MPVRNKEKTGSEYFLFPSFLNKINGINNSISIPTIFITISIVTTSCFLNTYQKFPMLPLSCERLS